MSVYLDASVVIPKLVEEPDTAAVDAYLAGNPEDRLVSDFAAAEVASVFSRLIRIGQLSVAEASAALADFEIWRATNSSPVEVHAGDVRLAYAHVRRFDLALRAPDALHLAIARRTGAKLVTFDRRLLRAASALGITAEMPKTPSARDR